MNRLGANINFCFTFSGSQGSIAPDANSRKASAFQRFSNWAKSFRHFGGKHLTVADPETDREIITAYSKFVEFNQIYFLCQIFQIQ